MLCNYNRDNVIKSDPIDLGEGEEASVVKEETGGRGDSDRVH